MSLLNGRCTSLLRVPVSEMTYTVSSGTLNSSIPYHTVASLLVSSDTWSDFVMLRYHVIVFERFCWSWSFLQAVSTLTNCALPAVHDIMVTHNFQICVAEQPWPNPVHYKIWGNMSIRQKRRLWTIWDSIILMYELQSGTECYRWWYWSVTEMLPPCLHSSYMRTFWLFIVTYIYCQNLVNYNKLSWNLLLNKIFVSDCRLLPDVYFHKVV